MTHSSDRPARSYLVESIPGGMDDLRTTPGVQYTEEALLRLTREARSTIDLTAMYWSLLGDPETDEKGFTHDKLAEMGAGKGQALYDALQDAAGRGVKIRILQSPGFSKQEQESIRLQRNAPAGAVDIHNVTMADWYGGSGIMHQKIWIFDGCHMYLGSANMDWKSLMQVKEMGVVVEDCPPLASDATRYFEGWWAFSAMAPSSRRAWDAAVGIDRNVPPWSNLLPPDQRTSSPLSDERYRTSFNWNSPLSVELDGQQAGVFLSGCPREVCGDGRTWDGDALVRTIGDARRSVCISVMDFAPVSLYGRAPGSAPGVAVRHVANDTPVWWPDLFNALLSSALTCKLNVRLLVSHWAHSSPLVEPFLRALQQAADAGRADPHLSGGQLEIKIFKVPGWENTASANRKYPGHSRVNHTKYIVTDRRINIGTSNMTWDYFASTAGSSFNTDHPGLVRALQAVFDRDWASSYAFRLA